MNNNVFFRRGFWRRKDLPFARFNSMLEAEMWPDKPEDFVATENDISVAELVFPTVQEAETIVLIDDGKDIKVTLKDINLRVDRAKLSEG